MLPFNELINKDDIAIAYEELGLKQARGRYYKLGNKNKPKVCPLVCLYLKYLHDNFGITSYNREELLDGIQCIIAKHEKSDPYLRGFMNGWDDYEHKSKSKKYYQGVEAGKTTWEYLSK